VQDDTKIKAGKYRGGKEKNNADIIKTTTIITALHLATAAFRQLRHAACCSLPPKN